MKNTKNLNVVYSVLSVLFAVAATAALLLGFFFPHGFGLPFDGELRLFFPLLWLAGLVAANIFLAASTVLGTEVKTVKHKNPFAQFSEDAPAETEVRTYRVPKLLVLIALAAALLTGFLTKSAVIGLLILFTWGGLGFPLALCILNRTDFGGAMQIGLLTGTGFTAIGTVIQVFLRSPGNSFDLKHCLNWILSTLETTFTAVLTEAKALAETQTIPGEQGAQLMETIQTSDPVLMGKEAAMGFLTLTPTFFTILMLALLCAIWWLTKSLLKRQSEVEVKYMGRLDGFRPSSVIPLLCVLAYMLNIFSAAGSPIKIATLNIFYILSVILIFAGFSLLLNFINNRIPSKVMQVLLTAALIFFSLSSCGSVLLMVLGVLTAGQGLRGRFGGGNTR